MLSYKDKLLFLSFQKTITTYISFIENELNIEAQSLYESKNCIPSSLSTYDKQYAHSLYDSMLSQNKEFKKILQNINSELSFFYTAQDFSLQLNPYDNIAEISSYHLNEIRSRL